MDSLYPVNQNTYNSYNNKSDAFSYYNSLSRKDKVTILMSKISKEKQSVWSIKDYEDMLLPQKDTLTLNNNKPHEPITKNEKNNHLKMSPEDQHGKNQAYQSPPPPLNQDTKERLQRSEKAMQDFNLEDQVSTAVRKTKEIVQSKDQSFSKRNSAKNFIGNYKPKSKVHKIANDPKIEKESDRCNLCIII